MGHHREEQQSHSRQTRLVQHPACSSILTQCYKQVICRSTPEALSRLYLSCRRAYRLFTTSARRLNMAREAEQCPSQRILEYLQTIDTAKPRPSRENRPSRIKEADYKGEDKAEEGSLEGPPLLCGRDDHGGSVGSKHPRRSASESHSSTTYGVYHVNDFSPSRNSRAREQKRYRCHLISAGANASWLC